MQATTTEGSDAAQELTGQGFWKRHILQRLSKANTFCDLADIVVDVQIRMAQYLAVENRPHQIAQVCGPTPSGEFGYRDATFDLMQSAIHKLSKERMLVFNQLISQIDFLRLVELYERELEIIPISYHGRIFAAGHIAHLYMIHGWETSQNARWEHAMAKRFGVEIVYL